ncbi:hypothetical protein ACN2WE_14915 [Streptomyces sp. cg28]|uniref:hypothetical protein n=1 Tax=Streptomyces sp. cg28 TaxID=3403457 RepID=UPI003B217392
MRPALSTHQLRGRRDLERDAKYLAPHAMRHVSRAINGRMPAVEITLTSPRGMAELAVRTEAEVAGCTDRRTTARELKSATRYARDAAGRALVRTDGSVLILVNADQHRTTHEVAVTLVHELVHAMQFSRRGVRERLVRDLRDQYGVAKQTRDQAREHARLLEAEEREAYRAEHLADDLRL